MSTLAHDGTLVDRIRMHSRDRADTPAVVIVPEAGERRSLSYAQLDERAAALAGHLRAEHESGTRALVLFTTSVSFVVALVACQYAGLIPVPSPLPGGQGHQRARVLGILADCDAAVVLVDRAAAPEAISWADTARRADGTPVVVEVLDDGCAAGGEGTAVDLPRPCLDGVAFLQYTSGSTSEPKGVVVTHSNVMHHHRASTEALGLTSADTFCSWLPGYHDFGLVGMLLVPLGLGSTSVLMTSAHFLKRPARWLTLLDETGATVTASPSFGYDHCVRRVRDEQIVGLDLSRLRWAVNGAEPVDAAVLDAFARRFASSGFHVSAHGPAYGLAEATLTISYPLAEPPLVITVDGDALSRGSLVPVGADHAAGTRLVGCGVAHGAEVRLADAEGRAVPEGTVGEIWVRGGGVASRYWGKRPTAPTGPTSGGDPFAAVAADGTGPWLRTGDLGAIYGGQLVVTGRIKEILFVAGRNLYPYDLERELRGLHVGAHSRPAAVFEPEGAPGTLCAVQEFRPTPGAGEDDLDDAVRTMGSHLAMVSGAAVHDVVLVRPGQVPRTTSGKIQRNRARDLLGRGELAELHSLRASRRRAQSEDGGTRR